jgi:hypothetical protein
MSIACPSSIVCRTLGASRYPQRRFFNQPTSKHCYRKSHRLALPFDDTVAQQMSCSGFRFEVFGKASKDLAHNA